MLKYIGHGAFIPDLNGEHVPARDLTDDEVKHFGEAALIKSGLYTKPKAEPPKPNKPESESK